MDRSLFRDLLNNRLAITGSHLLQYSRRLRYLRPNSPKGLGAGMTGKSFCKDYPAIKLANTGCHLLWRNWRPLSL